MALLELAGVGKAFGPTVALRRVSLAVEAGEIVALLGPSGCGKTTLLRVVAGLESPDSGVVRFGGTDLASVPPHRRNFGLMFQDLALFPHLNVAANVAFGLRMRRWPKARREQRVDELLELVGLAGFGDRPIDRLSGGERQRVALARSLAPSPPLLMLDEPLGALDRALRESLVGDLREILTSIGMTALYVTHDQDEALAIADRVAVLNGGQMEQIDTPARLLARPANEFVARFLGYENLLSARVERRGEGLLLDTEIGALAVESLAWNDDRATVVVPDDAATLLPLDGSPAGPNDLRGEVRSCRILGRRARLTIGVGDGELSIVVPSLSPLAVGDSVRIVVDSRALHLLPTGDSER